MNGAQALVRTLTSCGVEVCFANPGTSEMHFVAALDQVEGMRPVLCLFEGVATGAADGYGRIKGKPAATLLHLGPGLSNGLANLHNARKAATPIVNIVGDHATYHLQYDPPLTADISGLARTVSVFVQSTPSARTAASDAARAVQAARAPSGGVATLILPADCAWGPAERPAAPLPDISAGRVGAADVEALAALLSNGKKSALLLRGAALSEAALDVAGAIRAKTGARLLCDTFAPRLEGGAGRVGVERLPYFGEMIVAFLAGLEQLVLVGSKPPVSFFAYPDKPSSCVPPGCEIHTLSQPHEDGVQALVDLADALGARRDAAQKQALKIPERSTGSLTPVAIAQAIVALTPENAIYSDESGTSGPALQPLLREARSHTHLALTGGSIGQGLPLAVGAAMAAPDRKVVCPHADGGAAYTMQALWTMARENLDVTVVIYANRAYAILNIELLRVGAKGGEKAKSMMSLVDPVLDWTKIADGMGVEASRATTVEEFWPQYESAMKNRGPHLIEAII